MANQPTQHHFLPERAYLKLFEIADRPEFIYLYQRGKDPVPVNIEKAARESHLYTFKDERGEKNIQVEEALGKLEQMATPILQRLAAASQELGLTMDEKHLLIMFLAFQALRTPAHRGGIGKAMADMMTRIMQTSFENKAYFDRVMVEIEKKNPDLPKEGREEARQAFLSGDIKLQANPEYAMAMALGPAAELMPYLMVKEMALVKTVSGTHFVTSDHPVSLVRRMDNPPFLGGFAFSNIVFPLSRSTILFLANPTVIPERIKDTPLKMLIHQANIDRVKETNLLTLRHAERFLYAPESIAEVKTLFDKTTPPKRFTVS